MAKVFILFAFVIAAASTGAKSGKTVYYFVDAMGTEPSAKQKVYIYTFPLVKTTSDDLNTGSLISTFRKNALGEYGVSEFSSLVVRSNDNFDELRDFMSNSVEKFTAQKCQVKKLASLE